MPERTGLLHNRNFLLLWCAYAISAFGDHLSEMAILKTQHAADAGVDLTPLMARMTFVFMLPFFLVGPVCGALADRFPRRALMILADLVRAGLVAGFAFWIALCSPLGTWGPFVPLLFLGLFAAVFSPARSSLLPTLVREDQLVSSNAGIQGMGVVATILASVIGGYLAKHYDPHVSFRLDALTYVASAALVYCIAVRPAPARPVVGGAWRRQLAGGFRYILCHRRVMQLFGVGLVFWGAGSVVFTTVPALVKDVYGYADYQVLGAFRGLMGVGMLIGAVCLAMLGDALRSEIAITWALIGAGCLTLGLALTAFVPLPGHVLIAVGGICTAGMGACGTAIIAGYNSLLQRSVPDGRRGRVFGLLDLWTTLGLLTATGLLGIPRWAGIDRWVGYILLGMAGVFLVAGLVTLAVRLSRSPFGWELTFYVNLNEFLARFWYRLRREGPCTVPRTGPVIVVANHTCPADPLMLIAGCRYRVPAFMVAREYASIPFFQHFTDLIGCISVRRDGRDTDATKAALRHLRAGGALGIFIEGRVPRPGRTLEPKDGPAMLALRTGATVIPAHISGTKYHDGVAGSFFQRHRARVRFGRPVDLSDFAADSDRSTVAQATRRIHEAILAMG